MWRCGGKGFRISGFSRMFLLPPPKHLPANTRFGMAESGTALGIWVRAGICGFGAPASERTVLTLRTSPCAMVGILHREALDLPISKAGKWRNRAHSPSITPAKELLAPFSSPPLPAVGPIRFPLTVRSFPKLSTFNAPTQREVAHGVGMGLTLACTLAEGSAGTVLLEPARAGKSQSVSTGLRSPGIPHGHFRKDGPTEPPIEVTRVDVRAGHGSFRATDRSSSQS